jgi:hypothetical protein
VKGKEAIGFRRSGIPAAGMMGKTGENKGVIKNKGVRSSFYIFLA